MLQGALFLSMLFDAFSKGKLRKLWIILFAISITPPYLLNCVDMAFFAFQGKRTTADLLQVLNTGEDATALLPKYLFDFWYVVLIWIFSVIISVKYVTIILNKKIAPAPFAKAITGVAFLIMGLLIFLGARGSFELRPLSPIFAARDQPGLAPLQLNSPFVFIKSVGKSSVQEEKFYDWGQIANEYFPLCNPLVDSNSSKRNVIIIVVESLGAEYMNTYNPGKGITPFLDSLAGYSETYLNAFANGKTSIQGIPSVFSSIPSLFDGAFITSPFGSNETEALPTCLKNWGYSTAFFHGGKNGTMGFDTYSLTAGFQKYFGKNEYPNQADYDGSWGIYDGPFLSFAKNRISQMKMPFMAGIFTISSHHPYKLPPAIEHMFAEGPLINSKSFRYADYALSHFFQEIKNEPWYSNTIFVITADHTSIAGNAYFGGAIGMFRIPILIFDPKNSKDRKPLIEKPIQQLDIQNLVLSKLAYNQNYFNFGCMLDGKIIMRNNGMIQVLNDSLLFQFDGEAISGVYDFGNDSLANRNLLSTLKKGQVGKLELEVKSFLQCYSFALNRNLCTSKKWINFIHQNQHEK